jgi:hypothetical protein
MRVKWTHLILPGVTLVLAGGWSLSAVRVGASDAPPAPAATERRLTSDPARTSPKSGAWTWTAAIRAG